MLTISTTSALRRWLGAAALAASSAAVSADDMPLPPAAAGETIDYQILPLDRQFAPAVAGPDGSLLAFTQDGGRPTQWQIRPQGAPAMLRMPLPFTVSFGQTIGYSRPSAAKYASVAVKGGLPLVGPPAGTWLIGPTVEFIGAGGKTASAKLQWPRSDVKAVALDDGSVVVVGGYSWPQPRDFSYTVKVERVRFDLLGRIEVEALPPVPVDISHTGVWESLWGYSLVVLGKGRVMLAGSEYRNLTLILDVDARSWRKLPGMKQGRTDPALLRLPDGRVWASGGKGRGGTETSSEIWSPASETWSAGPDLPVPMAEHTALLGAEGDTALLAGGYFPSVLAWNMGSGRVVIAAQHAYPRRQAGVVALPHARLALLGGSHARGSGEAWGRSTPGVSILNIDKDGLGIRPPAWPTTRDGALLARRDQAVAFGGYMHHAYYGSEADLGTRLVERQDTVSGRVATLKPLPIAAGRTQAAWIGDGVAMVHAETADSDGAMRQWLGLVNVDSGMQTDLPLPANGTYFMSDGIHRRMRLVGAHAGRAWLVAEEGDALRAGSGQPTFEPVPRMMRRRAGFVGRVLADGRVVIAGGNAESELVAARSAGCDDCPVGYVGFGPEVAARSHEIFDPAAGAWSSSLPSRADGGPAAILGDGRVIKVGMLAESPAAEASAASSAPPPRILLEVSDAAGANWREIALPPEAAVPDDVATVQLRTVQNEAAGLPRALFFGLWSYREGVARWWWLDDIDAAARVWRSLGAAVLPNSFPPGRIDTGQLDAAGRRLFVVGGDSAVLVFAGK